MVIPLVHSNLADIQEIHRYQVSSLLRMKSLSFSTQNHSRNLKVKFSEASTSNILHLVSFLYETIVHVSFVKWLKVWKCLFYCFTVFTYCKSAKQSIFPIKDRKKQRLLEILAASNCTTKIHFWWNFFSFDSFYFQQKGFIRL